METRGKSKRKLCPNDEASEAVTVEGKKVLASSNTRLVEAIISGDTLIVESIMGNKDVDISTETLNTALLKAVENGQRQIVQMLLNQGDCIIDGADNASATMLLAAVEHGHWEIVEMLVQNSASLDCRSADGKTALMIALEKKFSHLVKYLLENCDDINLNSQDKAGKTALMVAVEQWDFETVERLLTFYECKINTRDTTGHTALSLAKRNGFIDLLQLIRKGAAEVKSSLSVAVESNDVDLVRQLLEISPTCMKDEVGDLIVLTAIHGSDDDWNEQIHCSIEILELLLQQGVHLEQKTWCCDNTALMLAARAGSEIAVEKLIKYGADLDYSRHNRQSALTMAAYKGHAKVVEKLIKAGANLKVKDKRNENVLSFAVMSRNRDCIATVLEQWDRLQWIDIEALEEAKMLDVLEEVKDKRKKLLNEPQLSQILCKAVKTTSYSFIAALVDHGADLNIWFSSSCPLFEALENVEMLRLLLDKGANVNNRETASSYTALMRAAVSGKVEVVQILLNYKADMYAESKGSTALPLAILNNNIEVVTALLDQGMDVNHVTQTKETALSCATKVENKALKDMLIKRGAT